MENQNQKGEVSIISKENNAVCIDNVWFSLGPKVKMQYIKKGSCEYSTEQTEGDENDLVVFCRSTTSQKGQGTIQNPGAKIPEVAESEMNRMSALKFAGNVYMGTAQEDDAKRLTTEAMEFLEKGIWVTTEKH